MTQYVICALQMEGFHCWPEADGELAYLKNSHRHIFFITAEFRRRSCEDIAAEILNQFENSTSCTVLEDGFGGARVVR